jgi:hypothetical protein
MASGAEAVVPPLRGLANTGVFVHSGSIDSGGVVVMWRIFAILCAASALAACQSGAIQSSSASGFDLNLVGKPLVINEPVTIPAGRARVFLQGGGVLGQRGLGGGRYNLYEPHCALEIDSVDHDGFIVPAGEYLVTRVERSVVSVVSLDSVKLASSTLAFGPLFQRSDRFHDGFHFWLTSEAMPAVRRLSCFGVYARWPDLAPPSLDEINAAMGGVARLGGGVTPGQW